MEFKDYYKTLGVDKNASTDEIKKAYRKLAREFHPDTNKNADAESKFKDISEAYEVLKDPEKRAKYDNLGSSFNRHRQYGGSSGDFNWQEWFNQGGGRQRSGRTTGDFFDSTGGGGISDFFDRIFGGGAGGFGQAGGGFGRRPAKRGEDFKTEVQLSFEEAFKGATRLLNVNGEKFDLKFKPGIADGQQLKISGKGMPGNNGGAYGDLLINVKVADSSEYRREGDDLYVDRFIDLYTAALGGEATIETLGGKLKIKIAPETQSGKTLKLKGQGMPVYNVSGRRGDLYVRLLINIPVKLSAQEKDLFQKLRDLRKHG